MKLFVIYILRCLFKMAFLTLVALAGLYVGYKINHGTEIYFKRQRKQVAKYGKLIAYMNRHYRAAQKKSKSVHNKRNEKWLYEKCYTYAKKCDELDVKMGIAHLKSDMIVFQIISVLISIYIGFSGKIVIPYAEEVAKSILEIKTTIGLSEGEMERFNEQNSNLQILFCIVLALFLILFLLGLGKILKKQQYLLCILEAVDNCKEREK